MQTPVLLNFFTDMYVICVSGLPEMWRMLITALSTLLCVYFVYLTIKKSSDKHPINWGYVVLIAVFVALSVLYATA